MAQHNQRTGRRGEHIAAGWLRAHGLQVLATNWRCREGEIDIVAQEGPTLVIVEVKTRSSTRYGNPAEAVHGRKLRRLRRLAAQYLAGSERHYPTVRIDVVAVLLGSDGQVFLHHLRGVT